MKDSENQRYLFSLIDTQLLVDILNGKIDAKKLVRKELDNRGLNADGKWIGFNKVKK